MLNHIADVCSSSRRGVRRPGTHLGAHDAAGAGHCGQCWKVATACNRSSVTGASSGAGAGAAADAGELPSEGTRHGAVRVVGASSTAATCGASGAAEALLPLGLRALNGARLELLGRLAATCGVVCSRRARGAIPAGRTGRASRIGPASSGV